MGVFAFYPNKQMTTGEGGMIVTDDERLAALCVSMRSQGRGAGGGWLAHERLGYNYRLCDINCAGDCPVVADRGIYSQTAASGGDVSGTAGG